MKVKPAKGLSTNDVTPMGVWKWVQIMSIWDDFQGLTELTGGGGVKKLENLGDVIYRWSLSCLAGGFYAPFGRISINLFYPAKVPSMGFDLLSKSCSAYS